MLLEMKNVTFLWIMIRNIKSVLVMGEKGCHLGSFSTSWVTSFYTKQSNVNKN